LTARVAEWSRKNQEKLVITREHKELLRINWWSSWVPREAKNKVENFGEMAKRRAEGKTTFLGQG
jgi:hypothetical protein